MAQSRKDEASARRRITERCLIAADVDKTILEQATPTERQKFLRRVAPKLLESAELGMKLAFVTGNSMSQLAERFLKWLIEQLCHSDGLELLEQFHFFCNSGGVYFHFPSSDPDIAALLEEHKSDHSGLAGHVFKLLTMRRSDGVFIKPRFVDRAYLTRTQIPHSEALEIKEILEQCGEDYYKSLVRRRKALGRSYNLDLVSEGGRLQKPFVDMRPVEHGPVADPLRATVQLTLKPILSFRHAYDEHQEKLFEADQRTKVLKAIQHRLDESGLAHYAARPGGRSSIDVTFEKLDKAYAMEFLIDSLNVEGSARQGQRLGANSVYFGDEVIVGGGNDYPVTRIPGLLVFAVNADKKLIPFLSHVFVPSSILEGPEATAEVLGQLNSIARSALHTGGPSACLVYGCTRHCTAIDCFKVEVFGQRIQEKIQTLKNTEKLNPDEWQVLHALVTLMHRDDPAARRWLAILVDELDAIMTQITENPRAIQQGIGTSHPDN